MIFAIIVIAIIGIVAFFHYVQGFFSATVSAVLAIIAAVLAVSYHESVVEAVLGGKAAGVAHGMTLAVMFCVIYLVLRVLFDKMVPGNVRFPAILDKVGGAAMGIVAGVFAAGVVTLVAQYMPFMPAIAGYARYAVDNHEVTLPAHASYLGRQFTSEVWHELKSQKPGQFDEADHGKLIVPVDDIVVDTVGRLSDGGSLSGSQPLKQVHPSLPDELFAQRLGVQTGATRVVTKEGLQSVDLFTAPALKFRDHEYSQIRNLDLKGFPVSGQEIRPTNKQVLLIVRVMFTRYAADSDHYVRFSPASARLVTHAPGGAAGEMVNYYPIGTVENGNLLYLSKPDDFLLTKEENGVDFAYLIDKSGFLAGGGQGPMKVSEGTFFEFKRMARVDLGGPPAKTISTAYKPAPNVKVDRKAEPKPEAPPEGTAAAPDANAAALEDLKGRLVGNWAGSSDAGQLIIEFMADGSLSVNNTPRQGVPVITKGSWQPTRATAADTLVINRTIGGDTSEVTLKFSGNDSMTLTSATTPNPITLQRR